MSRLPALACRVILGRRPTAGRNALATTIAATAWPASVKNAATLVQVFVARMPTAAPPTTELTATVCRDSLETRSSLAQCHRVSLLILCRCFY